MPRKVADRPKNVPDGCTNIAFLGLYVEVPDDVVFTVEMSVRTGLEGVYKLTGLEKDILEVYPSRYGIRYIIEGLKKSMGIPVRDKISVDDLPPVELMGVDMLKKTIVDLVNSIPPYYNMYLGRDRTVPLKKSVLHPEYPLSK